MKKYRHRCRWVKGRMCWQKGKRIRKSECAPCLIAFMLQKGFETIAGHPVRLKKCPEYERE